MDIQSGQNLILNFVEEYLSQAKEYTNQDYKTVRQKIEILTPKMEDAGYSDEAIQHALFFTFAFIDDVATWDHSLLLHYFNIDPSSDKNDFFDRVESLQNNPEENIELLELAYICISLGYQGKLRSSTKNNYLINLSDSLFDDIRDVRPEPTDQLSNHKNPEEFYWRMPPIWLTIIFTIIILFAIFLPYNNRLNEYTKPILHSLQNMVHKDSHTNEK